MDRSLKHRPKWFKRSERNYEQNLRRFDELVQTAGVEIVGQLYPNPPGFFSSPPRDLLETAHLAATDTLLRIAYFTQGKSARRRFYRWQSKSFVILFSNIFGSKR